MRRERWLRAMISCVAVGLLLGGCGGGGSAEDASTAKTAAAKNAAAGTGPPPAKAHGPRAAGQRACHGLSALEAAHRFAVDARRAGVRQLFIAEVNHPAPAVEGSAGYPRLVAALYATTLPARVRAEAAAGCAEELAVP